jgi:hypothetical protein
MVYDLMYINSDKCLGCGESLRFNIWNWFFIIKNMNKVMIKVVTSLAYARDEEANFSFWMFSTNVLFWNMEQVQACKIVLCIVWHHLNIESRLCFYQYFL